jgi:outer membrane beta-barrel protein
VPSLTSQFARPGTALALLVIALLAAVAPAKAEEDLFAPGPAPSRPGAAAPVAAPPPPTAPAEASSNAPTSSDLNLGPGEKDVNLGDRVKSVQHRPFTKAHRFAATGFVSASINDAFYQKWGGGGALSYAFADPFAVSLHYAYFYTQTTEAVHIAKEVLSSQMYATKLKAVAAADFQLTPVYGKFSMANKIVYYDLYLFGGFGAAQATQAWQPACEVGVGDRIFANDYLSFGVEASFIFYADSAPGGPTVLQHSLMISALVSFWFPGPPGEPQ